VATRTIAWLAGTLSDKFGITIDDSQVDTEFDELAIDSLILIELALVIRKELRVTLTDQEIVEAHTLSGLAAVLDAKRVAV
jgi:acyl carrier protein